MSDSDVISQNHEYHLLSLSQDIILIIIEYMGLSDDDWKSDYHPNAYLIYALCKHFNWLSEYRYGYITESEYTISYVTIHINGKRDVVQNASYIVENSYSLSPSGYAFYKQNEVCGNFAYIISPASNSHYYVINKKFYDYNDFSYFNKIIAKVHDDFRAIDAEAFKYIDLRLENRLRLIHFSKYNDFPEAHIHVTKELDEVSGYRFMKNYEF